MAVYLRTNDPTDRWEEKRFREGDVSLGVLPMFHIYGLVVVLHLSVFVGVRDASIFILGSEKD